MGSIPLAANALRPAPQPPNMLEQYGNLMQLRNMMQEQPVRQQILEQQQQAGAMGLQQQQMQMQSTQALMKSFANLDPSDPNYFSKGIKAAQSTGQVLPQQLQGIMNARLDFQNKAANLTKTQQDVQQTRGDNLHALGTQYLQQSDPEMAQNWPTVRQKVLDLHQGEQNFDPNSVPEQFPGRQWVQANTILSGMSAAGMRAAAAQQNAKYKVVNGTLMDVSGEKPQPAMAGQLNPQQWGQLVDSTVPATGANAALNQRTHSMVNFYLQQGNVEAAQKAITDAANQVGAIEKQTNPEVQQQKMQVAAAREAAYANSREYPVYDTQTGATAYVSPNVLNAQPGRFTVPSYSPEAIGARDATNYFIKGKGGQQLTAFNTAMSHLDVLDKLAGDLGNGNVQVFNKAAQAWSQQTGNPVPTNFAAAKNAMAGEVASALKASGATDQEIEKVDQTFDRAQSPAQLKGAIGTYRTLLRSKEQNLQGQYRQGMQGKPNFNSENGLTVIAPNGKSYSFKDQQSADAFRQSAGIQ